MSNFRSVLERLSLSLLKFQDLKNVSLLTILQQNQTSLGLIDFFNAHIKKSNLVSDFRKSTEGMDHDDLIELVEFNKELADMYSSSS